MKRVASLAELTDWHARIERRFGPSLVQEYIPSGGGEFGASLLLDRDARVLARFSHRRLRSYPVAGGPSTLRESIHCPEIEDAAERLLRALGWYGVAMVEFRRDPRDGRYKLIEVNHRFWGSLQLAVVSGVDFPALLCRLALGGARGPCPLRGRRSVPLALPRRPDALPLEPRPDASRAEASSASPGRSCTTTWGRGPIRCRCCSCSPTR